MGIMLGNLSIDKIENRMGIVFPEPFKTEFDKNRQENADTSILKENEWHCFDLPFVMVCGSMGTAQNLYDTLKPQVDKVKTALHISVKGDK